jgi:hypothetical protein
MRGVDVIQTVYALLIALGLREVFLAFYAVFQQHQGLSLQQSQEALVRQAIAIALFANIILLSVRFFWVPRNFRRLYFVSEYCLSRKMRGLEWGESSLNVFIILFHGLLHFLLCKQFEYFVFVSTTYDPLSTPVFATCIHMHVALLILNGFWLIYTNLREGMLLKRTGTPEMLKAKPGSQLWYRSNLLFALISVGPLVVFSSCSSTLSQCLLASYPQTEGLSAIPTSAYSIAAVFDLITPVFSGLSSSRDTLLACWALLFLGLNSLLDLGFTSSYYVILEDVEREFTYASQGS